MLTSSPTLLLIFRMHCQLSSVFKRRLGTFDFSNLIFITFKLCYFIIVLIFVFLYLSALVSVDLVWPFNMVLIYSTSMVQEVRSLRG